MPISVDTRTSLGVWDGKARRFTFPGTIAGLFRQGNRVKPLRCRRADPSEMRMDRAVDVLTAASRKVERAWMPGMPGRMLLRPVSPL